MLENTLYKLKNKNKLTLGFFGGSITEGAGASDTEKTSWRGAVTDWFRERYPDHEINAIQGAIGGTGSEMGMFRLDRDLLSGKPDLVFIEFSVNDAGTDYNEILTNAETILRKIYRADPHTDIVFIHTMTRGTAENLASGGEYVSRGAYSTVMHRYGIPQIDVGEALRTRVLSSGGVWDDWLPDAIHPNDAGYAVCARTITDHLAEMLDKAEPTPTAKELPEQISHDLRLSARLEDASENAVAIGFKKVDKSICGYYDGYLEGTSGASLTFEFDGRRIGMYVMYSKDSGDFYWSIDGGQETLFRVWSPFNRRNDFLGGPLFGGELENGHHTLSIRVADSKADESDGKMIRIGAFMVY